MNAATKLHCYLVRCCHFASILDRAAARIGCGPAAPAKALCLTVLLAATATSAEPTAPAGPGASPVQASRSRDALAVSGGVAAVLFSATDGAIVAVREKGRQGSIASSGEHGLWHVRFQDGSTLDAARFAADSAERTFSHEADPAAQKLRMNYRSAVINVSVVVSGREDGVELVRQVHAAETVSRLLVGQPAPESLRA